METRSNSQLLSYAKKVVNERQGKRASLPAENPLPRHESGECSFHRINYSRLGLKYLRHVSVKFRLSSVLAFFG
jgi:hypothetical protein